MVVRKLIHFLDKVKTSFVSLVTYRVKSKANQCTCVNFHEELQLGVIFLPYFLFTLQTLLLHVRVI